MASVTIDSGELPSAEGVAEGNALFQIIVRWQRIAGSFHEDCRFLKQMIEETDRLRLWEKNVGGFTYKDRDEFLRRKVLLNYELTEQDMIEIVSALKRDEADTVKKKLAQKLAADPKVMPLRKKSGRPLMGTNVAERHTNTMSSESAERIVRRLKRDHLKIAEALARGEFKSARAAAKAAGIVQEKTPLDQIQKLWHKLNREGRTELRKWILRHCATCGREGHWMNADGTEDPDGFWCDECCDEGARAGIDD